MGATGVSPVQRGRHWRHASGTQRWNDSIDVRAVHTGVLSETIAAASNQFTDRFAVRQDGNGTAGVGHGVLCRVDAEMPVHGCQHVGRADGPVGGHIACFG